MFKFLRFLKPKKDENLFPCKECVVKPCCSQACDKIEMNNYILREFVEKYNCCPDCGGTEFYEGPCGGASENIGCVSCGHWFNNSLPFSFDRIRIDKSGRFTN